MGFGYEPAVDRDLSHCEDACLTVRTPVSPVFEVLGAGLYVLRLQHQPGVVQEGLADLGSQGGGHRRETHGALSTCLSFPLSFLPPTDLSLLPVSLSPNRLSAPGLFIYLSLSYPSLSPTHLSPSYPSLSLLPISPTYPSLSLLPVSLLPASLSLLPVSLSLLPLSLPLR